MTQTRLPVTFVAALCCLLPWTACTTVNDSRRAVEESVRAAFQQDSKNEAIANDAIHRLRASLNSADCARIYVDASQAFQGLDWRDHWLNACAQIRTFGSWESLSLGSTRAGPDSVIHVVGKAVFSKATFRISMVLVFEQRAWRLLSFTLQNPAVQIVVPKPVLPFSRKLLDPPPRVPRKSGTPGTES